MKQNITLSLDRDLVRKALVLAVQRSMSVSAMIATELEGLVEQAERYEKARRQALADLDKGLHLGGQGPAPREELHER